MQLFFVAQKKLCLTPYLRDCTSYNCGFWYTWKQWYLQQFFFSFFQNTDFQVFQSSSINDDDELFLWYRWPTKGVYSLISSRGCCQRSSALQISNLSRVGFEPVQNLSSGLVEWSCTVVIMTTPQCHSAKEILRCAPPSSHVCDFLKKTNNFIFKATCTFSYAQEYN